MATGGSAGSTPRHTNTERSSPLRRRCRRRYRRRCRHRHRRPAGTGTGTHAGRGTASAIAAERAHPPARRTAGTRAAAAAAGRRAAGAPARTPPAAADAVAPGRGRRVQPVLCRRPRRRRDSAADRQGHLAVAPSAAAPAARVGRRDHGLEAVGRALDDARAVRAAARGGRRGRVPPPAAGPGRRDPNRVLQPRPRRTRGAQPGPDAVGVGLLTVGPRTP